MKLSLGGQKLLDTLASATSEVEFRNIVFELAAKYASLLGIDFTKEILPYVDDVHWWNADYGVSEIDGKAIGMSTKDAFRCLIDIHRTYLFAQGIRVDLQHYRTNHAGEHIVGIDAGAGTGILSMLLCAFGVNKVYAIEYNVETFRITERFLKELNLEERIHLQCGDATVHAISQLENYKAAILVSENLSTGLLDEPQYPIIRNLSRYLAEDALIIPYAATLTVSIGHVDWQEGDNGKGGPVWLLRRYRKLSTSMVYAQVISKKDMSEPEINVVIKIPTTGSNEINALFLSTSFQINKNGEAIELNPDTCFFLAKTIAYKLEPVFSKEKTVNVTIHYGVGRLADRLETRSGENGITLIDPFLEGSTVSSSVPENYHRR
jgi:predicted RNA methylase